MDERLIAVPGGQLAVQTYGGTGRAVLFLHTVGMCGPQWRLVARMLSDRCRPVSFDLPGHAHSTVPMGDPDDQWRHLPAVVAELGLERPLLVGHHSGAWAALVAGLRHPELFAGLVLVGGSMRRLAMASDMVDDEGFQAMLGERFRLGHEGRGEEARRAAMEEIVAGARADSLTAGLGTGLYDELEHSVIDLPDGGWMNSPTVATVAAGMHYGPQVRERPSPTLYERATLPTWVVSLSHGFDANLEGEDVEVPAGANVHRRQLLSGQWPMYSDPAGVVAVVTEALEALSGGDAPGAGGAR